MREARSLVVVASSAGGVQALIELLTGLPAELRAAVLIAQHMREGEQPTRLPEILNARSPLEVRVATSGRAIEHGWAFVAEPGRHLAVDGCRLRLDDGPPVNHVRPSADVLFRSAAKHFGPRAVGIVLSGTGKDGAAGCVAVRSAGGTTIAQGEASSTFFEMARAAIAVSGIDHVLELTEIAGAVVEIID